MLVESTITGPGGFAVVVVVVVVVAVVYFGDKEFFLWVQFFAVTDFISTVGEVFLSVLVQGNGEECSAGCVCRSTLHRSLLPLCSGQPQATATVDIKGPLPHISLPPSLLPRHLY